MSDPNQTRRWRFPLLCVVLAAAHFTSVWATGRIRVEHVLADVLLAALPWFGARAESFVRGAVFLALGGALFDSQGVLLSLRGDIATGAIRAVDRAVFPAPGGLSWPEWFSVHHAAGLDLAAGFAYANYLWWVFAAAVVVFFIDVRAFYRLCVAFAATIAAGIVIYLIVPAAPPWYVAAHGPGPADPATALPNAAGAARVDALLGVTYFARLYSRNPNVFAAMPSLHVAFPLLTVWTLGATRTAFRIATIAFTLLMAFAAVYLDHHWVADVVVGAALASAVSLAVRAWVIP
ncbi:MAG TPA: phosphatase PAP2 family protein [Haliangiales bacterium]|nr:phosphatase PAP2 family protein [Haliangiales bacterium]